MSGLARGDSQGFKYLEGKGMDVVLMSLSTINYSVILPSLYQSTYVDSFLKVKIRCSFVVKGSLRVLNEEFLITSGLIDEEVNNFRVSCRIVPRGSWLVSRDVVRLGLTSLSLHAGIYYAHKFSHRIAITHGPLTARAMNTVHEYLIKH